MKLSALAERIQQLIEQHGDVNDILDVEMFPISDIEVHESDGNFPAHWRLPKGTKYAVIVQS